MPTFTVETVTPKIAAEWLINNHVHNRNLRQYKVTAYANSMVRGTWEVSNDAIAFDTAGTLINGQHRLAAVFKANLPVDMLVGRGYEPNAFMHMDRGTARTMSDQLFTSGMKNSAAVAAVLRLLTLVENPGATTRTVSDDDMSAFLAAHPDVEHSAAAGYLERPHTDVPPSPLGAAHWLIAQRNGVELADYFIRQIGRRENEGAGSAVLALDNRARITKRTKRRTESVDWLALILKAWNKYACGKQLRSIDFPERGTALPRVAKWSRALPAGLQKAA